MNRITKALPVALLWGTLFAAGARAQSTYNAADCNRNSVNAVINGPTHTAVDGDVIQIPAGSCTWTTGIAVPAGIGITIKGTGTPNGTPATTGASASCSATTITDNTVGGSMFVLQPTTSSSLSRVSCMKVLGSGAANSLNSVIGVQGTCSASTCPNIRIDNITFDQSLYGLIFNSGTVIVTGDVFGVVDHDTVSSVAVTSLIEFVNYNNGKWNNSGLWGDQSWTSPNSFGTAKALYLENNSLGLGVEIGETEGIPPGGHDHEGGGRVVGRFNACNGCASGVSNHGTDSNGRPRGGRQIEFYGNSFVCTNTGGGCQGGVPIRSGVNLMFGNSLTVSAGSWFNAYMAFSIMRVDTIWGTPWNQCNGSGLWDDNTTSPPTCIDQPNRSGSVMLSTGNPPTPTGWVNEVIDPSYEWNDSGYNPVFGNVKTSYSQYAVNRDWYSDNSLGTPHPQTSATSPFNGTPSGNVGMGLGTLARRPTSCTLNPAGGTSAGVGYWATDSGPMWNNGTGQGQLFVCRDASHQLDSNGNATSCSQAQDANHFWCLYYTPYTYPHPLTTGAAVGGTAPNAPTGVTATVH